MPKISVIVPVYNVEKYLKKCVDSIIAQTHKNLEIILIDDGSTDSSLKICEEYAKDERVKLICQENSGAAAARNAGIDAASGDYIHFADADDYLEPNMYEELLKVSVEYNADFVSCSCFFDYENSEQSVKGYNDSQVRVMTVNEYFGNYLKGDFLLTVWNHICKREICAGVKFPFREELYYGEDGYTAIPTLQRTKKIAYLGKAFYHYVQSENSLVRGSITLPKIRSWFVQFDSWLAYSKTQGNIFDKQIIYKYKDIVKKFSTLVGEKTKIPIPAKLFSVVPYSAASFISKFFPKI